MNNLHDVAPLTTCTLCGGLCEPQRITLTLRRAVDTFVLVRDVPADVCQECGEAQFTLTTAEQLSSAIQLKQTPDDISIVPVYDFPG